jgi:hypothetical protein
VIYFAVLFQLEPSSFAFRIFSAKRKSQRRVPSASMTITTTFVSVCEYLAERSNVVRSLQPKADNELKKEGRGSFDYATEKDNKIIAVKWYDNKPVHLLSTYVGIEPTGTVKRWSQTDRKHVNILSPDIVRIYNTNMGGVDLNDMLVTLYRTNIGVKRYYFRILFHLVDASIVNAWLIYRPQCAGHNIINFKKLVFLSEIGQSLKQCDTSTRKRRKPSSSREGTPNFLRKNLNCFKRKTSLGA